MEREVQNLFFEIVRVVLMEGGEEGGGSSPTFRFAFISYKDRDFWDKNLQDGHLQYCNFTTDSIVAVQKLAGIHAFGGGWGVMHWRKKVY